MKGSLGKFGEAWAAAYLTRRGYAVLDRNVRFREGEIDIVARDGNDLVFVEVKCRATARFGSPEESITAARYARLATAVQLYLQSHDLEECEYRVDVIAIVVGPDGRVAEHRHLIGVGWP